MCLRPPEVQRPYFDLELIQPVSSQSPDHPHGADQVIDASAVQSDRIVRTVLFAAIAADVRSVVNRRKPVSPGCNCDYGRRSRRTLFGCIPGKNIRFQQNAFPRRNFVFYRVKRAADSSINNIIAFAPLHLPTQPLRSQGRRLHPYRQHRI